MSYRSNLLLVTCVTYFGFVPHSAASYAAELGNRLGADSLASIQTDAGFNLADPSSRRVGDRPVEAVVAQVPPVEDDLADVKPGNRGQRVAELQAMLQELGYYNSVADGVYGRGTITAVSEFQAAEGLNPSGEVDAVTWERLEQALISSLSDTSDNSADSASADPASDVSMASASPADEPAGESSSNPSIDRGWLWWILAALGTVIVGGGIAFAVKRRRQPEPSDRKPNNQKLAPLPNKRPERSPDETAAPMLTEGDRNGHSHTATDPTSEHTEATEPSALTAETPALSETTRLPKIDIVEELIKDLNSPDPRKRRKAVWELGQRGNSKAIQPLVDLMIDSDSNQRSLILASVSEIAVRSLKPMNRALLISLQDESSEVRKNAIRDLTRVYDMLTQASQFLRHAVDDSDQEVQETARWALGQINRIRTAPENDSLPHSLPNSNASQDSVSGDVSDSN